jgi:hypothetical protein
VSKRRLVLQYKHTLGQNSWQHHNHHVAAIAGIEQVFNVAFSSAPNVFQECVSGAKSSFNQSST